MSKRYASLFVGQDSGGEETDQSSNAPYHLLMVDDEPQILAALRRVFQYENYHLHFAGTGTEALKVLADQQIHLIISDFMMPHMNGSELLAQVRERWPQTIRIMLTGHANTEAVMGSVKEGAVYRFILKPWDADDLRLTIALALEQYDLQQRNRALEKENHRQHRDLETLAKLSVTNRSQLAIMLHKKGLLNAQQIQQLHKEMQTHKTPVMRQLMQHDWIESNRLYEVLRKDLMFEEIDLREFKVDLHLLDLIPQAVCTRQLVLPLRVADKRLRLAMADPMDQGLIEELGFITGYSMHPLLCRLDQLQAKLVEVFGQPDNRVEDLAAVVGNADPYESIEIVLDDEGDDQSIEALLGSSEDPPAIRLVNAIILEALRRGASDIHIQPRTKHIVVRYRIDGVLQDKIQIPSTSLMSLVSRIKVMAELDITERRRPQDGRITVKTPMRIADLRISTLPTINGEKVVMRVLERQAAAQSLEELGLSAYNLQRLLHVVKKPQGMILATGPTGSGKTTTLFAMLLHEASAEKNYVTIEDPVEFQVDLASQVPVRERIGLGFAGVLRAIMRQDPDVILLGEIRDEETADVAFNAALTGHLVFSTLHTNSAAATVIRLFDLGIKPFVLASALEAIIAQRLVRRICPLCRQPAEPSMAQRRSLGAPFLEQGMGFFQGRGCNQCNNGYKGRIALLEIMVVNDRLRTAISEGMGVMQLQTLAREQGMITLLDDAREKVALGLTTIDEVLRLLGPQDMEDFS
ncbi:MAG: ATPase, T2SS/T4P/T4SS family [Pseudomonas sp.]|uniref:ATPase, T2SS/T4P/T4SS family n=1 Tax=Pseudomonas sp. TaxID=306 RepID=UPI003D6FB633